VEHLIGKAPGLNRLYFLDVYVTDAGKKGVIALTLGVVVDEEDEVGVVDEPLAGVVERVTPVNLSGTPGLEDARNFGEGGLK